MTMRRWMTWAAVAALALLGPAPARADSYSKWTKNEKAGRWECDYSYETKAGTTARQKVLVYPKGPRAGWAYFVNDKGKAWGRCAIKGNPKYKPKVMYWKKLKSTGTGYEDSDEAGYCPTPADGKKPIRTVPHPPI
jgi:hypothetical protein